MKIDDVRTRFPHARTSPYNPEIDDVECLEGYCVGGALYMAYEGLTPDAAGYVVRYPGSIALGKILRLENDKLTDDLAEHYALRIVHANDRAQFEHAWTLAEEALNHGRE